MQTKTRQAARIKRLLCVGGSIAAIVVLILLMTGTSWLGGASDKGEAVTTHQGAYATVALPDCCILDSLLGQRSQSSPRVLPASCLSRLEVSWVQLWIQIVQGLH